MDAIIAVFTILYFSAILPDCIKSDDASTEPLLYLSGSNVSYNVQEVPYSLHELTAAHIDCALRCVEQHCFTWKYNQDDKKCSIYVTSEISSMSFWNNGVYSFHFKGNWLFCYAQSTLNTCTGKSINT